jgi:hypothetical protein
VIESPTVNRWKAEAKVEALLGLLKGRFDSVPAEAKEQIKATTALDVLQRWVILAATADSLDAFRRGAGI